MREEFIEQFHSIPRVVAPQILDLRSHEPREPLANILSDDLSHESAVELVEHSQISKGIVLLLPVCICCHRE